MYLIKFKSKSGKGWITQSKFRSLKDAKKELWREKNIYDKRRDSKSEWKISRSKPRRKNYFSFW